MKMDYVAAEHGRSGTFHEGDTADFFLWAETWRDFGGYGFMAPLLKEKPVLLARKRELDR